jgi:hypothetical protein
MFSLIYNYFDNTQDEKWFKFIFGFNSQRLIARNLKQKAREYYRYFEKAYRNLIQK